MTDNVAVIWWNVNTKQAAFYASRDDFADFMIRVSFIKNVACRGLYEMRAHADFCRFLQHHTSRDLAAVNFASQ
jgi:hypothetical protein